MISRFRINGLRRLFAYKSLYQYTTAAAEQPIQTNFLVEYLIKSLGLSKDEAFSATKKVTLWKSCRNDPDSVVNFFQRLGLNKTQIISIVSTNPRILTCNVDKTLQPKVLELQEIGICGSDLTAVLMSFKSLLSRGVVSKPIEYLRNLLGSNESVVEVVRKYSSVLDISSPNLIQSNVEVLQKHGLSKEFVLRFMLDNPRCFMQKSKSLERVLFMVENEFGIPPQSRMFYHGVLVACSITKPKMDMKIGVLKSFGLSDPTINNMIKMSPNILKTSEDKMRKMWNFFTKEIGCTPDFLASHPVIFNLSFEKRVIPRYEVLKILNEKQLIQRKASLYWVLCMAESNFVNNFLLRYNNKIPVVVANYFHAVGRKKAGEL